MNSSDTLILVILFEIFGLFYTILVLNSIIIATITVIVGAAIYGIHAEYELNKENVEQDYKLFEIYQKMKEGD